MYLSPDPYYHVIQEGGAGSEVQVSYPTLTGIHRDYAVGLTSMGYCDSEDTNITEETVSNTGSSGSFEVDPGNWTGS